MTGQKNLAVIPARYESSRLPGKPLADIAGKSLIQRVWEQVSKTTEVDKVIIATDDERIVAAFKSFGALALLTSPDHRNGSERVAEVLRIEQGMGEDYQIIVNVQGDMPFINPDLIDQLINGMKSSTLNSDIGTIAVPITEEEEFLSKSDTKVVIGQDGRALYFSRAPIPHVRDQADREKVVEYGLKHVGLYAFKPESLFKLIELPPSPLEGKEKLEQLRGMENGMSIFVQRVPRAMLSPSIEVDTPEDLERAVKYCRKKKD